MIVYNERRRRVSQCKAVESRLLMGIEGEQIVGRFPLRIRDTRFAMRVWRRTENSKEKYCNAFLQDWFLIGNWNERKCLSRWTTATSSKYIEVDVSFLHSHRALVDTLATDCDTVSYNFFPQRDSRWSICETTTRTNGIGTDLRWIHLGLDSISWMAAFLELRRNAGQILGELEHLAKYFEFSYQRMSSRPSICREAEYAREFENRSALTIQATWRGHRVRSHLKSVLVVISTSSSRSFISDIWTDVRHWFKRGGVFTRPKWYFVRNWR